MTVTETAQAADTHAAVLITYSNGERPEFDLIVPTRMTKMAALAAREYFGDEPIDLVIAGERSTKNGPTTGELLAQDYTELLPSEADVNVLPAGKNRLLNTTVQVEAIAEYVADNEVTFITAVGWDFHRDRFVELVGSHIPLVDIKYVTVEEVLKQMEQEKPIELAEELERMGFEVGISLDRIFNNGIRDFAEREERLRCWTFGKKGRMIKFASWLRGVGRYDDLKPDGSADMGTSEKPWYWKFI